jgi:hypothetical protein
MLDDRGSTPGRGWEFFSSQPCPHLLWGPTNLLSNGYREFSTGVKRSGRDADHSPPSSAEVKSVWSYTSTPIRLHGVVLREVPNKSSRYDT